MADFDKTEEQTADITTTWAEFPMVEVPEDVMKYVEGKSSIKLKRVDPGGVAATSVDRITVEETKEGEKLLKLDHSDNSGKRNVDILWVSADGTYIKSKFDVGDEKHNEDVEVLANGSTVIRNSRTLDGKEAEDVRRRMEQRAATLINRVQEHMSTPAGSDDGTSTEYNLRPSK